MSKIKVALNGYGVIGKRIADAIALQPDMELVGVSDVVSDWRIKVAGIKKYPLFAGGRWVAFPVQLHQRENTKNDIRSLCDQND